MRAFGWQPGWSWCAIAAKKWWLAGYRAVLPELYELVSSCFSPSVQTSERRFQRTFPSCVSQTPAVGSLCVFHSGVTAQGHIGLVVSVGAGVFQSVEGNTNSRGGREGIEVAGKTRKLDFARHDTGLWLSTFIAPPTEARQSEAPQ